MKLTREQVKHVTKLANLPLTSEEEEKYAGQLSKILDYVDQLNRADTSKVEATFNVLGQNTIEREDKTSVSLSQKEVLSNTSQKKDGLFVTKGVFEEE